MTPNIDPVCGMKAADEMNFSPVQVIANALRLNRVRL